MVVVRFRADCPVDIDRFHAVLSRSAPGAVVSERVVQPFCEGTLDAHVEAEWTIEGVDLKTLVQIAASIPECRCIAETIQQSDRYTGERDPHRAELAVRPSASAVRQHNAA